MSYNAVTMNCGAPSGAVDEYDLASPCMNAAQWYIFFDAVHGSGGWYLCEECLLQTVFWLDDHYPGTDATIQTYAQRVEERGW